MLELLLVIYLCRRGKNTLVDKGYKVGLWQLWIVLAWYGTEIGGAILFAAILRADIVIAVLSGVLCAVGVSIAIQRYLQSLPDIGTDTNNWINNIGQDEDYNK